MFSMNARSFYATLAVAAALLLSSCDILGNVEPKQSVEAETALETKLDYEALLTSIYDRAQGESHYGETFMLAPGALADNIQNTPDNSNRYPGFARNNPGSHMTRYNGSYAAINETNYIISQIGEVEFDGEPQSVNERIEGEARFMRALNYFDLVRTKAYEPGREVDGFDLGVPIRTEPTEASDEVEALERATNDAVYDLIESDLTAAIDLLGENVTTPLRANQVAAQALLARVHLYQGALGEEQYANAEQYATAALENAGLVGASLVTVDTSAFETGSTNNAYYNSWTSEEVHPESLFELDFEQTNDNAVTGFNESVTSLTLAPEQGGGWGDLYPTRALYDPNAPASDAHEDGDVRATMYQFGEKGGESFPYIQKWQPVEGAYTHNHPVMRYSLLLLIRAEARAEQGNLSGAIEDINTLRSARGLDAYDGEMSTDAIVEAVMHERRVEFAFEGYRFFDLKRRGMNIPKPQDGGGVLQYRGGQESFLILAPLPTDEVDQFGLTQNPGY
jgi:hypothetical protein